MRNFFLVLFTTLTLKFASGNQSCLRDGIEQESCLVCSFSHYKVSKPYFPLSSFETKECSVKNESIYIYTAFISADSLCNDKCDGTRNNPYKTIEEALVKEQEKAITYYKSAVDFILLSRNNTFIVGDRFPSSELSSLFRRISSELKLRPGYCSEFPEFANCVEGSTKIKIFIKSKNFRIFVAGKLRLENLIFDGSDLVLPSSSPCFQNSINNICCNFSQTYENPSNHSECKAAFNQEVFFPEKTYGLINIEQIFDDSTAVVPRLEFLNSEINNFYVLEGFYSSIVNCIKGLPFSLSSLNTDFTFNFLPYGLVSVSEISDDILNVNPNLLPNILSSISMENSKILGQNYYQVKMTKPDFYLFNMNKMKGKISLRACNFIKNSKWPSLTSTLISYSPENSETNEIWIEDSTFINNNVDKLIEIRGTSSPFLKIKLLKNNFEDNLVDTGIGLTGVNDGTISLGLKGIFPRAQLIKFSYSNIKFLDSTILNAYPPNPNSIAYVFYSESYYFTSSIQDQFKIKTNLVFTAFDEIMMKNLTFKFSKDISLVKNLHSLRTVHINDSYFEGLTLIANTVDFFTAAVEGLFLIYSCNFKKIISSYRYIFNINPVYNLTIKNSSFSDISLTDSSLMYFYSETPYNTGHLLYLSDNLIENIQMLYKDLTKIDSAYKRSLIATGYSISGQGFHLISEKMLLRNIKFEFYKENSFIFEFASGYLNFLEFHIENIDNCTFLFFILTMTTGRLILKDISVNFTFNTMARFHKNSVESYDLASIENLKLLGAFFKENSIFSLNNPKSLIIINSMIVGTSAVGAQIFVSVPSLNQILIRNNVFSGSENYYEKFSSMTFSLFTGKGDLDVNTMDTNYNTSNLNFGIIDCVFIFLSNSVIRIRSGGQIYIRNISAVDILGYSGGMLYLETGSVAFIESIFASKINLLESGGLIYVLSSNIVFRDGRFNDIQTYLDGGAVFLKDSVLKLVRIETKQTKGFRGGFLISESSDIKILNSSLSDSSSQKSGGFLIIKFGKLNFFNLIFSSGFARDRGSCLYLEEIELTLNNVSFLNSKTENMAALCFLGINATIYNITFINNSAPFSTCLVSYDSSIILMNSTYVENVALKGNLIELYSSYIKSEIKITRTIFKGNKFFNGGIYFMKDTSFYFDKGEFINNTGVNFIISTYTSNIEMSNAHFSISSGEQEKIRNFYLIDGKKSNINLFDSIFLCDKAIAGLTCENCILLKMARVEIYKASSIEGSALFLKNSSINIELSKFVECQTLDVGIIYMSKSEILIISNTLFLSNKNTNPIYPSNIYFNPVKGMNPLLKLKNCTFKNVEGVNILSKSNKVFIESCLMVGSFQYSSQGLYCLDCKEIQIKLSNMNTFLTGGAIYIFSNLKINTFSVNIIDSKIYNCSSSKSGGGLSIYGNAKVEIFNSDFFNDKSNENGGAINFNCLLENNNCLLSVAKTNFSFCHADSKGGAIFLSAPFKLFDETVIMKSNTAAIGNDMASIPTKINIFLNTSGGQENKKNPDSKENFLLKIGALYNFDLILMDSFFNELQEDTEMTINLELINTGKTPDIILENNVGRFLKGVGSLRDFSIAATNIYSNIKINLTVSSKKYATISKIIEFSLLKCDKGEVFIINRCIKCPEGFFSLENDTMAKQIDECTNCPKNAMCYGGKELIPNPGYWRDEEGSLIAKCQNEEICVQNQIIFKPEGQCAPGYSGHLCEQCMMEGFAFIMGKCEQCFESNSFWLVIFFGYIIFFLLIFLTKKGIMKSQKTEDSKQLSVMLKLLINHISYFTMVSIFNLDMRGEIMSVFNFLNFYSTTSPQGIFNYECLFHNNIDSESPNLFIIICFSPLIFFFIYFASETLILFAIQKIRSIFKKCSYCRNRIRKEKEYLPINMLITFAVIMMNLYPTLMIKLINAFRCVEIEANRHFMVIEPEVECWGTTHTYYLLWASNFIVIWGFGYPAFLFQIAKRCFTEAKKKTSTKKYKTNSMRTKKPIRVNIKSEKKPSLFKSPSISAPESTPPVSIKEGFFQKLAKHHSIHNLLIQGYRNVFYYWECVVFLRKLFVIFISLLKDFLDLRVLSAIISMIFFSFYFLNEQFHLYSSTELGKLESFSILILISSINFGLLSSFHEIDATLRFIFLIAIFLSNIYYFFTWISYYIRMAHSVYKKRKTQNSSNFSSPLYSSDY